MEGLYEELAAATRSGISLAVVTIVRASGSTPRDVGAKMLVRPDGSTLGSVGGGALEAKAIAEGLEAIAQGTSRLAEYALKGRESDVGLCGGEVQVFVEVVNASPTLLIAGAGHVGQALARLGSELRFNVIVADDREEYAAGERFPATTRVLVVDPEELAGSFDIDDRYHIVIATRGHEYDEAILRRVVREPAAYIGLVGSRRKVATLFEHLLSEGLPRELLAKVHAPIGLDIGAVSPEEIALSIMAEIVMVREGATGRPLAEQGNPLRVRSNPNGGTPGGKRGA